MFRQMLQRKSKHTFYVQSPPENRAIYEITWKYIVEPNRPQMTICRMRIACWILKATNTHSEYVILIAFSLQQWLHERASLLRYYVRCLSCSLCVHHRAKVYKVSNKVNVNSDSYCTPSRLYSQIS
jgi:hypothetical protein